MYTVVQAIQCASAHAGSPSGPLATLLGSTEQALFARLREGDPTAFDTVYLAFYPRLVAIANGYVQSSAIAEEIAQDTLLMVWERRAQWQDNDSLVIYLYATARNKALKHLRHQGIVGRVEAAAIAEGDNLGGSVEPESIEHIAERQDLYTILTDALNRLPEMQRTAFTLRWIHQLSYEEVAGTMGISLAAARQHVARARTRLLTIAKRFV